MVSYSPTSPSSAGKRIQRKKVIHHSRSADACGGGEDLFETELLGAAFRTEAQKLFFKRLDAQLNMVNKFYRCKEHEYITWASQLQRQINTLIETRGGLLCKRKGDSSPTDGGSDHIVTLVPEEDTELGSKSTDIVYMSKTKIKWSEKVLRGSFTELYRGLGLLKDYSSLNLAAFGKILKKYDKITGQNASDVYLRAVGCSYFASSDKPMKVMNKVESLFTQHFTKHNRREALAYLKPTQQSNSYKTMFLLGLFSGSSVILLVIFVLLIAMQHQRKLPVGGLNYPQFEFCTSSTLGLLFLHLYMYGFNVFIWQRVHINHAVILEFAPGKKLGFCDILLLSTAFTTILLGGMVMQLVFYSSAAKTSVLPLTVMLALCCLFLILPIDIFCKSIRFTFLRHIWHIICSPLYKVTFSDFFLADQLTSQITAFQNFAWILCYYICRDFKIQESTACKENMLFQNLSYFVSVLPYWWRLMQCLRTWLDEGDLSQIANGGKYLSALVAMVTRVAFKNNDSRKWLMVFVISSAFATCYQLYWDVIVDWGLLQPKSVNPWLRDKLILRQKYIYFVSVGINTMLRLAWLFSVLHLQDNWIDHNVADFLFASMEVFRRGIWNFFRLENEHLKNMARYRAVKTVPSLFGDHENEEF